MTLSELSLRRPVFATVVSLLIIVGGLSALLTVPVRELPETESAQITVSVGYSGAAPEVVDAQITTVIEGAIAGIAGVETISSESERGSNRTVIEFSAGRDIDQAANDVRAAVSRVVNQLPDSADQPRVRKNNDQSSPVVWLTLTSDRMTPPELSDYASRYLVDRLATVDGVADVNLYGERAFAMRLWLDREAMAARDVTVGDISAALRDNNVELPAGRIETAGRQFQVRTATRLSTPEEFSRLTVKTIDGYPVLLGDVAEIERGVENDDSTFRGNFRTALGLGILPQSQSNTVDISNAVRTEIEAVRANLPEGMSLEVSNDDAVYIRNSIAEVLKTLGIAVVLVVAVIFAFLASFRATIVPAVTIPIALIGACAGIALFGFSINILTLFALILAIGLVVDDAIVVLENIQRRIEEGEDRLVASALGSRQVTFAILATSATLIAVFVPISFLQGQVGRLFSEFGLILAIAVAVSTFVALSLTPVLCAALLRDTPERGLLERLVDRVTALTNAIYRRLLRGALAAPYLVIAIAAVIGATSVELYQRLPKELTPQEDRGVFFVSITAPQGSNLAYTDRATRQVEEVLRPYLDDGTATALISIVGRWGELRRAFVVVRLPPWAERERNVQDIISELRPKLGAITDARAFPIAPAGLGLRGASNPLRVVVGGPNFDEVEAWSATLEERMRADERLTDVERDFQENQPGFNVTVDRDRARDLGIDVRTISEALQTLFASAEVTEYTDRGRQYPVMLQAREEHRSTPADLASVFVRAPDSGELVPLSGLIELQERASAAALNRHNRLPSVEIQAGLAEGTDLGQAIDIVRQIADAELPGGATISFSGQAKEFLETSQGVEIVFALALLIVYLVLAAQFESFIHPVVILLSVPLAVSGAFLTLLLTGISLNIYSQVGLVLLVGLVAKNGILIVEFANQLRDEGMTVREAILEGSVLRLRPIMMTVISTLLGALPLAISTGAGAEARTTIGLVIIGGFALASFLTLFLTPVLYDLLAGYSKPRGAIEKRLNAALGESGGVTGGKSDARPQPAE
ncbi:efflux RND transporter permease subunit [Lutibaculum baratangense]|uniref:RND multidrug efflux transporter n=1 Tax=Lutibaculum baratangense AMV1 TaxID=631454 RepID=V4QTK6_9HYPH|nr:efflux RND transporter permease subunit [Lutibaculum baratangense]ESR23092.1 RND multidrug efflux transporter [Lutibaculum baratangense AMV1]